MTRWKELLREEKEEGANVREFLAALRQRRFQSGSTGQGALYMKHNAMGVVMAE